MRELKASGHYVIITTSRLMQECGGNVGAVIASCGNATLKSLADLQAPRVLCSLLCSHHLHSHLLYLHSFQQLFLQLLSIFC